MANRIPYSIDLCRFKDCTYLKTNDRCRLDKCIYNHKQIIFWEKFGIWKGK